MAKTLWLTVTKPSLVTHGTKNCCNLEFLGYCKTRQLYRGRSLTMWWTYKLK